jgi:hypothetical protein
MDFPLMTEAKNAILDFFHSMGIAPGGHSNAEVLHDFFNLQHKFIKNRPRKVLLSNSLMAKVSALHAEAAFNVIVNTFKEGLDINPFLSKGVARSGDHDYLLNDWQIHHLHLNASKKRPLDYFNSRSAHLLFIHVTDEDVYLIDIRPHKENHVFAQRDLLRIIRDNWPDLNKRFLVKGEPMEIYPKLNEQEIDSLRRKGYMFFTEVDGYAYMPGQGSTTSGFSLKAGLQQDKFHRELYKIQSYIEEHEEDVKAALSEKGNTVPDKLEFKIKLQDWMFDIYEASSQQMINFDLESYTPKLWREMSEKT